jgi:hypothetical protein
MNYPGGIIHLTSLDVMPIGITITTPKDPLITTNTLTIKLDEPTRGSVENPGEKAGKTLYLDPIPRNLLPFCPKSFRKNSILIPLVRCVYLMAPSPPPLRPPLKPW